MRIVSFQTGRTRSLAQAAPSSLPSVSRCAVHSCDRTLCSRLRRHQANQVLPTDLCHDCPAALSGRHQHHAHGEIVRGLSSLS